VYVRSGISDEMPIGRRWLHVPGRSTPKVVCNEVSNVRVYLESKGITVNSSLKLSLFYKFSFQYVFLILIKLVL